MEVDLAVDVFNTGRRLICSHTKNGLHGGWSITEGQQVFERPLGGQAQEHPVALLPGHLRLRIHTAYQSFAD